LGDEAPAAAQLSLLSNYLMRDSEAPGNTDRCI